HFDKERTVQRFAYDTISDRRSTPAGAQVRISVAVFLDARRVDPSTCATIASLVRAAAGADLSAGDDVVVQALPFAVRTAQAAAGTSRTSVASRALVPVAVILALALLGVALGRPVERPRLAELTRQNERHGLAPEHARALAHISGESAQTAAYVLASLPPDARRCVLEACEARRRRTIALYLKHHHDC
ncbi:MAG TPA: flagellar M-ring protein FliF C-terminal domain-containing protein, partial [Candidatus Eremiobacteraceae bacterium]|nr:flagellar M-ring protein FliF C-terminal domain-containing protein [Candidatus Eremiobacteraceae bacterium]